LTRVSGPCRLAARRSRSGAYRRTQVRAIALEHRVKSSCPLCTYERLARIALRHFHQGNRSSPKWPETIHAAVGVQRTRFPFWRPSLDPIGVGSDGASLRKTTSKMTVAANPPLCQGRHRGKFSTFGRSSFNFLPADVTATVRARNLRPILWAKVGAIWQQELGWISGSGEGMRCELERPGLNLGAAIGQSRSVEALKREEAHPRVAACRFGVHLLWLSPRPPTKPR
jgi:hypothetical protein